MSKKREAAGVPGAVLNSDGPWGGDDSADQTPSGKKNGHKTGGKAGSSEGSGEKGGGSGGPRNPWDFPPEGPKQPRRNSLDDLGGKFRDAFSGRGGGGSGPGGNNPMPANLGQYWPWFLGIFALLWVGFTSVHRIEPQERGVILRLGSYAGTLGPGVSFTLPAPFDKVEKIDVSIRELPIGAGAEGNGKMMLTADQNLISLAYTVRWRVSNPELYSFQIADPDQLVSQVAESAMREVIANYNFTDAIGPRKGEIQVRVAQRIQQVLDSYKAGITIEEVVISDANPPKEVKAAFTRVTEAQQNAQKNINDANAFAAQVVKIAEGETAEFNQIYEQYKLSPRVTKQRLYYETMERVLQSTDKTIIEAPGVNTYLPLPQMQKRAEPDAAQKGAQ